MNTKNNTSANSLFGSNTQNLNAESAGLKQANKSAHNQSSAQEKTLIACMGNMLMRDEGFGPYMFQVLTKKEVALKHFDEEHTRFLMEHFCGDQDHESIDKRIPVMDGATMGMSFVPYIEKYDKIIIIDVIDFGRESDVCPGSVFVLTPEDMAEHTVLHTLHDLRVIDVINNAALAGHKSDITCICAQLLDAEPEDFDINITEPLYNAVPTVVGALLRQLGLDDVPVKA